MGQQLEDCKAAQKRGKNGHGFKALGHGLRAVKKIGSVRCLQSEPKRRAAGRPLLHVHQKDLPAAHAVLPAIAGKLTPQLFQQHAFFLLIRPQLFHEIQNIQFE